MNAKFKTAGVSIMIGLWLVAIGFGSAWLNNYSSTPGKSAAVPIKHWPQQDLDLVRATQPVLAVFLHPKCPCSRATLGELARLQNQQRNFETRFFFFLPKDKPQQWIEADLWKYASSLSNHAVHVDKEGNLARQLGAQTSGHCVLVTSSGDVRYSGGLTSARGHEGDNQGRAQLRQILSGELSDDEIIQFPVFGCPIHTPLDELETSEPDEKAATCCQRKAKP